VAKLGIENSVTVVKMQEKISYDKRFPSQILQIDESNEMDRISSAAQL
jgi:hypothetical protein